MKKNQSCHNQQIFDSLSVLSLCTLAPRRCACFFVCVRRLVLVCVCNRMKRRRGIIRNYMSTKQKTTLLHTRDCFGLAVSPMMRLV